jgi:hypothetical protein
MKLVRLFGVGDEGMTRRKEDLLGRFSPGFAAHRYRLTPEEIERNRREGRIQQERDERAWRQAMEKEKEGSQNESDDKPA